MILLIELVALLLLWELAAAGGRIPFLPPPTDVLRVLYAERAVLWGHFLISARRVLMSVAFSVGIGAPLAILSASSRTLDRALSPIFYFFYPVPKVVFLPILFFSGWPGGGEQAAAHHGDYCFPRSM